MTETINVCGSERIYSEMYSVGLLDRETYVCRLSLNIQILTCTHTPLLLLLLSKIQFQSRVFPPGTTHLPSAPCWPPAGIDWEVFGTRTVDG